MNSVAIQYVMSLSPLWLYGSVGGIVVACGLLIFLMKSTRKKRVAKPKQQPIAQKADIQQILKVLPKANGRVQPVLLAAGGLADLPVTIPVNLAVSLAGSGKCLLIDFDSKRDALAKVFEIDSSKLQPHLKTLPLPTEFENLSIWPARYFDLLKQMNLRSLLDSAGRQYDHILLYAPYLTVLPDRKQIAFCSKQAIVFCKGNEKNEHMHGLLKAYNCEILLAAQKQ